MGFFADIGLGAIGGIAKGINDIAGNVMDRFWPKKMNEKEKVNAMLQHDQVLAQTEVQDVNKAREMWQTFLMTQKLPWLPRFLNGMYRPTAGFFALFYLTDRFWGPLLTQYVDGFTWVPIERDVWIDGMVAVIIYFFFGYRHKAKTEGVSNVG